MYVAIYGKIGSGKSSVMELLRKKGYYHDLYRRQFEEEASARRLRQEEAV